MSRQCAKRTLAVILFVLLAGSGVFADDHTPKPYSPDEFQTWAKDLWRADVIMVGSFPFAIFATFEVYDTIRYVGNKFDSSYAPWPLGSGSTAGYTSEETLWLAVSAVSLSAIVAGLDFIFGQLDAASPHG